MSSFKNPIGPQPTGVYWRRRLIVGLGALVVIIVIILIVVRPGTGAVAPTPSTSPGAAASTPATAPPVAPVIPAATDTAAPTASGAPSATATSAPLDDACAPANVSVVPITDAGSYAAGDNPMLSLSVTNTGKTACSINSGSDVQEYVITSGEDRIWSSKDCQTSPVSGTVELQPGVAVTTETFAWSRIRSDAADCDNPSPTAVTADGASYHLDVSIDGIESTTSKQFILN